MENFYYEFLQKDDIFYQDFKLFFFSKRNEIIEIQFTSKKNNKPIEKEFKFNKSNIINIPNDEILSKIIIGNILKNKIIPKKKK